MLFASTNKFKVPWNLIHNSLRHVTQKHWKTSFANYLYLLQNKKAKPDNDRTYYDNSSRSNASSVAAQNEMKSDKAEAELSKTTITESNAKERNPEVLIQSEYIFKINACKTFLLSVSEENYQQTRQSSWQRVFHVLIQRRPLTFTYWCNRTKTHQPRLQRMTCHKTLWM